jgi:PAS domain S-box-containing protein
MRDLIEARDWSDSPLGPPSQWPQSLRTTVGLILPAMAQIVLFWGPEFVALYNDAYAPTIGGKHPRALGRPARENWAELWDDLEPLLRRVRETGETVFAKDRPFYIERHGYPETVYFDISYSPVPDESGAVGGVLCIVSETTERVESERRTKDSETRFKAMADSVDQMIWSALPDGYHDYYNRRWYEYTGVPEGSTDGEAWNGMFHPDDQDNAWSVWRRCLETGEPYHIEYRLRHRSGDYRWVLGRAQPVRDEDGAIVRWYGTCTDIHDLKLADEARRESDERFRAMADSAPSPVWVTGPEGIEFANKAFEEVAGVSAEQLTGTFWTQMIHPDDLAGVLETRDRAWADRSNYGYEARFRMASGDYRWMRVACRPRFDAEEALIGYVGLAVDIDDARQAEQQLREDKRSLETLNRIGAQIAPELDLQNVVQMVTDAGVELSGAQFGAFFYNVLNAAGESYMLYTVSGVDRSEFDKFPMPRNTAIFAPTFGGEGPVRSDDITKDPRYGLSEPYHGMPEGHLPVTSYLAVPVVSRSGEVTGGLFFGHARPGRFTARHEELLVGIAGQAAVAIDNARLFEAAQRELVERRRAEEELRESEERFRRIADSTPVAMWVTRLDRKRDFVNQAYVDFLGIPREAAADFDWRTIIHPEDRARIVAESIAGEATLETFVLEGRYKGAGGGYRWLRSVSQPRFGAAGEHIGFIGAAYDITEAKEAEAALRELNQSLEARIEAAILERERVEEALRQAQKMEAVGQLTGGIAHDFNNLLTVIAGNLDLVARRLGPDADPRIVRAIGSASVGADRAATLTQRLLAFSRRQPLAPKAIDPNALVAGMTDLLHRTIGETIEVETRLSAGIGRIEADPHQLESAVLNLAVNARDAMPDGGRLVIETSAAHVDAAEAAATNGLEAGTYAVITVSDTGFGMDSDTVSRAIEPFFTTKDVGKGTGLGLSMVYGFVKQSGGHLKIESKPGQGTRVHIYLPRFTAESPDEEQSEAAAAPRGGGDEIILVCEDDHDVRAYTVELLGELGYQVLEAPDGAATLRIVEDEAQRIDLLFTDVVLPGGMSGAELAKEARRIRPGLKILYTTGYARDAIVHEGRLDPGIELVAKPFAFAELAARVREMLDRS